MPEEEVLVKKVPPNSIDAERSVIGAMLYDQSVIPVAMEYISGADFYQHHYGVIYDTLVELYGSGRATDIVTLQNALKQKDIPPEVYSIDALKDLLNSVFTSANARSYAEIVQEKSKLRRMLRVMEEMSAKLYLGKESTDALMKETEQKVFNVLDRRSDNAVQPISEVIAAAIDQINLAATTKGGITGLETGFKKLDQMLLGFHESELIIIGGRSSMGKTAFALNIAAHFAIRKNYPIAFFEMEMPREQLAKRLLSMEAHVNSQNVRSGNLSQGEWDDIISASALIGNTNFIIDDTPGLSVQELRTRCKRYAVEHQVKAIFVDYLQLMSGSEQAKRAGRQSEMSEISMTLKAIARELKVPVIALAQLNRDLEKRGKNDHRPQMSDIRDSGQIEQDADVILFLYRDEVYNEDSEKKGIAEVNVAKQRNGPTGTIELVWLDSLTKFTNLAEPKDNQFA